MPAVSAIQLPVQVSGHSNGHMFDRFTSPRVSWALNASMISSSDNPTDCIRRANRMRSIVAGLYSRYPDGRRAAGGNTPRCS